ncbi:MAG: 4-(cytidine 5'-diphospho)-2-C-methyl-D-erythritol kinase [Aquiluna sp.]|nr:4-(cytidine 5'-diphospho)-2-C-methyl-D-erythritol kinase [Aquiluna sp.]MCF8545390.1 4-(cytidine 5'-diphospho)-2-C-methyl-D-erythritol kinase [Aquiluna sp.]
MIYASAQGKINLYFAVGPRRPDGYHNVLSLYQAVDLKEIVGVEQSETWKVSIKGNLSESQLSLIPTDETNIVILAAKALAEYVGISSPQPMHFEIQKGIPVAGGMAGGSADAAAALVALNEAWCLGLEQNQLLEVAAKAGADVPFALLGGTAIGTGIGTDLEALPPFRKLWILLLRSDFGLSTKAVFEEFDRINPSGDKFLEVSEVRNLPDSEIGKNSLRDAALSLRPELGELLNLDLGISAGKLSGSGPTIWFHSESLERAELALSRLQALGQDALLTQTVDLGARLG